MASRRTPARGLDIELLDVGVDRFETSGDADWVTSSAADSGGDPRPGATAATKWLIAGIVGGLVVVGVSWIALAGRDAPTGAPVTTIARPTSTTALISTTLTTAASSDVLTMTTQRADFTIDSFGATSVVFVAADNSEYRLDLESNTMLYDPAPAAPTDPVPVLSPGETYIGDAADGTPVIQAADGRAYLLAADGRKTKLADGRVDLVENGWFAERVCTTADECVLNLHGLSGIIEHPYHPDSRISFSPDGRAAVIWAGTGIDLIHTEAVELVLEDPTGSVVLGEVLKPGFQVFVQQPSSTKDAAPFAWRPDGTAVAFIDDGALVILDVASGTTERRELPAEVATARVDPGQ